MWRHATQSLAGRLALILALVQVFVVLAGMAAWMLTSPYVSWTDVAAETAAGLVAGSVTSGPALRPDPTLAAYAARRPELRYAALVGGKVLPGSSPDLTEVLAHLGPGLPAEGRLAVPMQGGMAAFSAADTSAGPAVIVTAGNRFRFDDDLPTFFSTYAVQLVPMFGPAILAAVLVMPLAIRIVLLPIRRAARTVETIDLDTLDRRLPEELSPAELRPFLAAINRLLARLEEGVQRQRLFTANAAHEMRTPVAVLQARVDTLPAALPVSAELAGDTRRITVLLDQLLAVARIGAQEASLQEPVDLPAIAAEVIADMAPLAIRSRRSVALELEAAPVRIAGNCRAIVSAITNLLGNALRAEPAGGTVRVRVGPGPRVSVTDHGPGVAEADQPFLFEPFWRKEDRSAGSGLGLAIVREVARLHGGNVTMEPTPGGGATFIMTFREWNE
jgi:signal transduction histidine kinase